MFSEKLSSVNMLNPYFFLGKQDWKAENQLSTQSNLVTTAYQDVYCYLKQLLFI